MDFTEQINNGIALLDSREPNWRDDVDVNTLDLHSLDNCVLGQVFGDYGRGMEALFGGERWMYSEVNAEHGFEAPERDENGNYIARPYADLTEQWVKALTLVTV